MSDHQALVIQNRLLAYELGSIYLLAGPVTSFPLFPDYIILRNLQKHASTDSGPLQCKLLPSHFSVNMHVKNCSEVRLVTALP